MEKLRKVFHVFCNFNVLTYFLGIIGLIIQLYICIQIIIYSSKFEIKTHTFKKEICGIITMTSVDIGASILLLIGNFLKKSILVLPVIIERIVYLVVGVVIGLVYQLSDIKSVSFEDELLKYSVFALAFVVSIISIYVFSKRYLQLDATKSRSDKQFPYMRTL